MTAFRAGDVDAFDQLHKAFNPRVLRFLLARVGKEDAWDISQNVWLRIFRRSHQNFDPSKNFVTWLLFQARSELTAWFQKQSKIVFVDIDEMPSEPTASDGDEGHRILESIETNEQLRAALAQLKPAHREILILRFFEGIDLKGCVEILGIPLGTVATRQHTAIENLRRILGDLSPGTEA